MLLVTLTAFLIFTGMPASADDKYVVDENAMGVTEKDQIFDLNTVDGNMYYYDDENEALEDEEEYEEYEYYNEDVEYDKDYEDDDDMDEYEEYPEEEVELEINTEIPLNY
jgi:hypothetical protein